MDHNSKYFSDQYSCEYESTSSSRLLVSLIFFAALLTVLLKTVKLAYSTYTLFEPEHISPHRPIILDENYQSPESAALHEGGYEGALVAGADSPSDLHSMSAYGKPQPPNLHGYDTGRTYPETSYPFVAPTYVSQPSVAPAVTAPVYQNGPNMSQIVYPSTHGRSFEDQSGPFLNVGSTPIPEVTNFAPSRGARGTKFFAYITSLYELMTTNEPVFYLMFGQRKERSTLARISQQGAVCQYAVSVEVPPFSSTGWSALQVPVSMFMESGDGDVIAKVDVGQFTFTDGRPMGEAYDGQRKRKLSIDSADIMRSEKRILSQPLRQKEEFNNYGYTSTDATAYSSYFQPSSSYPNLATQYSRAAGNFQAQPASRNMGFSYSNPTTASPILKAKSPQVPNWSPSYSSLNPKLNCSPTVPSAASRPAVSSISTPTSVANPPLVRTTTLHQTPSPASTPHGGAPFNAYALYPNKAKLEINGNLDAMALDWTPEEWESKRRIVHFRRVQSGSTITTSFSPISVDERPLPNVCISCIYWEERKECFVTSVDTIFLLEQLLFVSARFTVEEKNRIRRNLEGFRPLTVSKSKPKDDKDIFKVEEFFKLIMGFPNPKPRNIEKDVKVFHWKDLSSALQKIFGKYCAGPSSTLPPAPNLLTPASSTSYASAENAGVSYANDHHGAVSPRSVSVSTTSTAYVPNIPARALSPHNPNSMPSLQSGPPDLRVSVPHPHETSSHWQGSQHHMPNPQQYQQHLGSQTARTSTSWDMGSYLENSPATAGGTSTTQTNLDYNVLLRTADSAINRGGDNRILHSLSQQQHQQHQQHSQHQQHQHQQHQHQAQILGHQIPST